LIKKIQSVAFKHGYLIITAAWLYTFSFITYNYLNYNSSPEKVANKIQTGINKKLTRFEEICKDTVVVSECLDEKIYSTQQVNLGSEKFGFFVYALNDLGNPFLTFWNSNRFYVRQEDLIKEDGNYFVSYQNGSFIFSKKTIKLKTKSAICVAMIQVKWSYFIENTYLQTHFVGLKNTANYYEIGDGNPAYTVKDLTGNELFKIVSKKNKENYSYDLATIWLRIFAMFFLALFVSSVCAELVAIWGFFNSYAVLITVFLFVRICTYLMPFPFSASELPLFDPSVYAANFIHPSLGDLLVNTIIIFWFINFYRINHNSHQQAITNLKRKIIGYGCMVLLALSCLTVVSVIRSLIVDSKISFDVTNFFSLTIYSFISFIILSLLTLSFFYLSQILLNIVYKNNLFFIEQLIAVSFSGLIVLSLDIGSPTTLSNLFVLLWLVIYVYISGFKRDEYESSIFKSSLLIFWIMFFAVSISSFIIYQNREVEIAQRKRNAELLSLKIGSQDEDYLKIGFSYFSNNFLQQSFPRFYTEFANKFLKDSLLKESFSGYLNKYDTRIYTYDTLYKPLHNDDSTSFNSIRLIQNAQGKKTDVTGLYSIKAEKGELGYLLERSVEINSKKIGYVFVLANPKKSGNDALYPVLFKQSQDFFADLNSNYAYAIYYHGRMIKHINDYDFPLDISLEKRNQYGFNITNRGGYSKLWYFGSNDKQVLIIKKNDWFFQFVALFAYFFSLFLLILILFYTVTFLLKSRFKIKRVRTYFFTLNIKSQINLIIVGVCFISFLVIGIATISFFIIRFNNNNEERLYKSIKVIAEEIQTNINSHFLFDDVLTVNDIGVSGDLERKIVDIALSHAADINFYDEHGKLKVSTQPYIYNRYLLSQRMNPTAFYELAYRKRFRFSQSEKIGNLSYLSYYIPIMDETGKVSAYLNIPYLNSQIELNQEISGFLATLINLNAFIFLLAGAIAFIVANRITSSFSVISEKMRALSLGKINEPIEWNRHDEIGELVTEYNIMVSKLDNSVAALAKAERESAWREMARQVAHEIKNPLTPMKLSIQYLQKSLEHESNHIKELSQQVSATLIEQIDQLSKIAGDFSQFANINNANPRELNIVDTITSVIKMHNVNESIQIELKRDREVYMVYADKIQMSRLFTNLIKNAIEATSNESETIYVKVFIQHAGNKVLIMIADNGVGIEESLKDKIFTPNFTTKSSGTGLGLAICKGIVENANGKIWFETQKNKGTIFFVELPLEE
jgi:signal transduction histidine kinase/fumarate reductase subunit D